MPVRSSSIGITQNQPSSNIATVRWPPSGPAARSTPVKWPKYAVRSWPASVRRKPRPSAARCRAPSVAWPLASSRQRAATGPAVVSSRTPAAPSDSMPRTVTPRRTSAPPSAASCRSQASKGSRSVLKAVCGSASSASAKRSGRPGVVPAAETKVTPGLGTRGSFAARSARPSRSRSASTSGSSDSPTWKCGPRSRSSTATRRPARASRSAATAPPGPPPITTASSRSSGSSIRETGMARAQRRSRPVRAALRLFTESAEREQSLRSSTEGAEARRHGGSRGACGGRQPGKLRANRRGRLALLLGSVPPCLRGLRGQAQRCSQVRRKSRLPCGWPAASRR